MTLIIALAAVAVLAIIGLVIALIVGIDLAAFLISFILPFALVIVATYAAMLVLLTLKGMLLDGKGLSDAISDSFTYGSLRRKFVLGIVVFVLFTYLPRNGFGPTLKNAEGFVSYDVDTGKALDVVVERENVEKLRELLGEMKMHRHYRYLVPEYLAKGLVKPTVMKIGLYDGDGERLAIVHFEEGKHIGIQRGGKLTWYDLYAKPKLGDIERVFKDETRERTRNRVQADNGDALRRFVNDIAYEDGELVITVPDFTYETSLKLNVSAVVQSEKLSYAFQDLDLLELAEMSGSCEPGDVVRVPVPQERRYRELYVGIVIDGVGNRYDVVRFLEDELRLPGKD